MAATTTTTQNSNLLNNISTLLAPTIQNFTQQQQQNEEQHNHFHIDEEQSAPLFTEPVSQTKLLASLVLFFITLLCGYLPVRCILNQNYIQYAMFAGGGVLMATAFCHLIPEAHDNYKLARGISPLHSHHHHHHHMHDHHQQQINDTFIGNITSNNNSSTTTLQLLLTAANGTDSNNNNTEPYDGPTASESINIPYLEITLCCGFFFMYLVEQLMVRFINNHTHEHPCDTSMGQLVVGSTGGETPPHLNHGAGPSNSNGASTTAINLSTSGSTSGVHGGGTEFYKFLRGLLIVSAFGAHSIFDGVAIGSQETIEKVWTIFLAISCHKLIIAAVVGLELYAATLESNLWTLVHLSIFSIMSPIGIILVVLAQNSLHLDSNHPAMILLQSFATGTLLYIVFVEILQPKESQQYEKNRIGKSFSLIAGFALMLIVLTVIGEG